MTLEQMAIVRNMLGFLHTPRETYRNRFSTRGNDPQLDAMAQQGIVQKVAETQAGTVVYRVTDTWLNAMGVEVSK